MTYIRGILFESRMLQTNRYNINIYYKAQLVNKNFVTVQPENEQFQIISLVTSHVEIKFIIPSTKGNWEN